MRVEVEVTGAMELSALLHAHGERLEQPLEPLLQLVADAWQTDFQENFQRQGTVDGGPWEVLAPMTQRMRKWKGFAPDKPILVRTSDLLQSIRLQEQTEDSVSVGTNLRYAAILQEGGVETYSEDVPGERTIPARPFIELHAELIEDTGTLIEEYFFPGEGAAGV